MDSLLLQLSRRELYRSVPRRHTPSYVAVTKVSPRPARLGIDPEILLRLADWTAIFRDHDMFGAG